MNDNHNHKPQRLFTKVRGYPGIFKVLVWSPEGKKYVDPRSIVASTAKPFRALRRVKSLGKMVQQCAHFDSIEEAKAWRFETSPNVVPIKKYFYSIGKLIEDWREGTKPPRLAESTWQYYGKAIKHLEFLYEVPVEELSAEDIDKWLKFMMAPSYPKPRFRNSFVEELDVMTTILHWYREYKNPRYQLPILRRHRRDCWLKPKPARPDLSLKPEDLERFLERLRFHHLPVYYYVASFQALTGARIGEACGLKWDCVDLERGYVMIRRICWWAHSTREPSFREGTKTGETRTVLLPPRLISLLKEWKENGAKGEIVFHKDGNLLRYPAVQNAYKKAYRKLGLPNRSTHVLRHTFGSIHANQTKDIRATQAAMGHRDLRITQHYAKATVETQQNALPNFKLGELK